VWIGRGQKVMMFVSELNFKLLLPSDSQPPATVTARAGGHAADRLATNRETAVHLMVDLKNTRLLGHATVKELLQYKWDTFVSKVYYAELTFNFVAALLLCVLMYLAVQDNVHTGAEPALQISLVLFAAYVSFEHVHSFYQHCRLELGREPHAEHHDEPAAAHPHASAGAVPSASGDGARTVDGMIICTSCVLLWCLSGSGEATGSHDFVEQQWPMTMLTLLLWCAT
jgi:hypothetical protein